MASTMRAKCGRPVLVAGVLAAVVSMFPSDALAHPPPSCPETWNPAAQPSKFTGVPGGWSTAPGTTNPSTPQNPDGFFILRSGDGHDLILENGCSGIGGVEAGNGNGEPIVTVESGTVVKYTEANGKTPGFEPMAGNNGNGQGNSTYVDIHVWGQGDLQICDAVDPSVCTCCYVPPPPFTPPQ